MSIRSYISGRDSDPVVVANRCDMIDKETTMKELAVLVSQALEEEGITATLSGGGAVSIYSDNAYQSADLDFISSERNSVLERAIVKLGFSKSGSSRMFEHPETDWYLEFPPGPLGFGDTYIDPAELPILETEYGPLRIITPTLSIADRLAAYWYHGDRQTWDQAIEVVKRQSIDWDYLYHWAEKERQAKADIDKLRVHQESMQ